MASAISWIIGIIVFLALLPKLMRFNKGVSNVFKGMEQDTNTRREAQWNAIGKVVADVSCPSCHHQEAARIQPQEKRLIAPGKEQFRCKHCRYVW